MSKQFIVTLNDGHTSTGLPTMEDVSEYLKERAGDFFWNANVRKPRRVTIDFKDVGSEASGEGFQLRILLGLDETDNEIDEIVFAKGKNRRLPIFKNYPTRRQAKKLLKKQGAVTFIVLNADTHEPLDETS